ncbi:hypothetical protein HBI56_176440 [Parastagonospora nodorum]|uniref:Uncharacterized protein n=1 Tax=Phaeosphaeria nodorum (strain SN15 / ATCC MYA-4574 / FGSC 10173) TaxID=321614 RepID=A0A7U2FEV6_PHANO|nr:hypothetical protein HBH56_237580 [Parastagonospora nodorum]QRD03853.1 hypothetical protein JI435_420370 [Parastagonospora nodorum SN15]KAH3924220.1 hypothetical protein HBH54_197800 [Parastagonospora nodorum]KAH3942406.1 hypothetical protein HBH53_185690 [Parastagonospora nodorum]KAH3961623.1 hypothetical protein HBH51_180930 [Parastagonospora nodorum]
MPKGVKAGRTRCYLAKNTPQNNFNLRSFSRVPRAMSAPAVFLCQALAAHRHLLGYVWLALRWHYRSPWIPFGMRSSLPCMSEH